MLNVRKNCGFRDFEADRRWRHAGMVECIDDEIEERFVTQRLTGQVNRAAAMRR
jgi:hypothetical protein